MTETGLPAVTLGRHSGVFVRDGWPRFIAQDSRESIEIDGLVIV